MAEIIGLLIAIGALLAMLPGLMHWTVLGSEEVRDTAIAQQAGIFEKAAEQYLSQNSGALLTTATPTAPVIVTTAELQTGGFLPSNYTSTNVYGQTWELEVLQPTPGVLQAVAFTTGGQSIEDEEAARISGLIGASGGFVPVNNSGAYPQGSTLTAYGTQGAWTLNLKNFQGITKGELASYVSLVDSTGQVTSNNYLYRYSVPGNSELNTMHTPLIMAAVESNGAACATTGSIAQDGTGALLSCQAGVWTQVGNSSWKAPVGSYAALPASGNALGDVRLTTDTSRAYAWNGGSWQALSVDQNGNLTVPSTLTAGVINANGSVTAGGNITANGEFDSNSSSWALQSNATGAAKTSPGSINVSDSFHRAAGIQYPWYSQMSAQVYSNYENIQTNTANINTNANDIKTIDNTLGIQSNEISNNANNIATINNNLSSNQVCAAGTNYGYNALNQICAKAVSDGINVTQAGSIPPTYSVTTTTGATPGHYLFFNRFNPQCVAGPNASGQYNCSIPGTTTTSPASYSIANTTPYPELYQITVITGYHNGSAYNGSASYGANWGNLGGFTGCSAGTGSSVIVTVNGTQAADIASSQEAQPNYQQPIVNVNTETFLVPSGGTGSIQANTTCVGFSGVIWTL